MDRAFDEPAEVFEFPEATKALRALALFGEEGLPAIPDLRTALDDPPAGIAPGVLHAISNIGIWLPKGPGRARKGTRAANRDRNVSGSMTTASRPLRHGFLNL